MSAAIVVAVAVVPVLVIMVRWIVTCGRGDDLIVILVMVGRVILTLAATRIVGVMVRSVVLAMTTVLSPCSRPERGLAAHGRVRGGVGSRGPHGAIHREKARSALPATRSSSPV